MKNKEKNFISAVIYVRNNAKDIENFIQKINNVLCENFLKYEIICINDCSTDDSRERIEKIAKKLDNVSLTLINMSYFQGKEMSMNAGIDIAIGDFLYEFDNVYIDYNINLIMDIYIKALDGYDIVSTYPNKKLKKSSAIFYKLFNMFSNIQYKISTENFKIISRRAINRIQSINMTIPYRKAIYANCGLKMATIKYNVIKNININSDKKSKNERKNNAINSLILFTDVSYKFSIIMSIVMILMTIGVAAYTISIFISSHPIQGWTTTMLFLSFGFFGIFAIQSIIIKYLSIIIDLIFKKSKYIIESVDKLN